MPGQSHSTQEDIPDWLIWIQCIAFVVLYAFWILPEIVGVRNTSMIIGALASLYPIYVYREKLIQRQAFPLWLIGALFVWAIAHYFFFSQDPQAQVRELHRIWRYAAICAIFGIGLGLSLSSKSSSIYWRLIYFGLCTPLMIYLIKYIVTNYISAWEYDIPIYLKINNEEEPYHITKINYTIFCMPALATTFGLMAHRLNQAKSFESRDIILFIIYCSIIFFTFSLFYIQNIKNAIAYGLLICSLFIFKMTKIIILRKNSRLVSVVLMGVLVAIIGYISYQHFQKNESWRMLIADTKIAIQKEKYDHWKWGGEKNYPQNEYGKKVSPTNYDRVAWALEAIKLIRDNPNGYGLIELSFRRLMEKKYPETIYVGKNLSHSHSGWLDIFLGLGIFGGTLIIGPLLFKIWCNRSSNTNFSIMIFWSLMALLFCWVTSEVSMAITFMSLIFWITLACTLRLNQHKT